MGAKKDRRRAAERAARERRQNRQELSDANTEYDDAIRLLKEQPVTDYFADDKLKYTGVNMADVATAKKLGYNDLDEAGNPLFTARASLDPSKMAENYAANTAAEFERVDTKNVGYEGNTYGAGNTTVGKLQRGANTGLSNVFNNLQVSTAGAEMEAQEADQALAASQNLAAQAGTGAGGATALAAAAAKSKQGISANIDMQVKANEQLRAQGEQSLQRDMLGQGNLASQFDLGQDQFNVGETNRQKAFNATSANQAMQFTAGARNQANQFNATGAAAASQFNAGQDNLRNSNMFNAGNSMRQFNAGQQNTERLNEYNQLNNANNLNITTKNQMLATDAQNRTQFDMGQAQGQQGVDEGKYGKQLDLANIAANDLNNQNQTDDALKQIEYATG